MSFALPLTNGTAGDPDAAPALVNSERGPQLMEPNNKRGHNPE
ncbi:MAG TPA: hypothetical protein VKT99_08970 [Xanthobacteraceae bacterium]|nr:hypothetical protein [Xanthobacteraceae bacterium]